MSNKKNPVGRPSMPDHLKAKPISKAIRVPIALSGLMQQIAAEYKKGSISLDDVLELVKKGSTDGK